MVNARVEPLLRSGHRAPVPVIGAGWGKATQDRVPQSSLEPAPCQWSVWECQQDELFAGFTFTTQRLENQLWEEAAGLFPSCR